MTAISEIDHEEAEIETNHQSEPCLRALSAIDEEEASQQLFDAGREAQIEADRESEPCLKALSVIDEEEAHQQLFDAGREAMIEAERESCEAEPSEPAENDEMPKCKSFWDNFSNQFTRGYQGAVGLRQNGMTRNRPYFEAKTVYKVPQEEDDTTLYAFETSLRGWYDFKVPDNWGKDLQIRSLFFDATSDKWSVKTGVQEIAWGETFGLYPADLVNPRDYTDPFFNELVWIRIPTTTLNVQFFEEPWTVQFVCTPVPVNNWLPNKGSPWDVFPAILKNVPILGPHKFSVSRCGQDVEYGVKTGYLFESGIDLSLIYFRHWNRDPVYRLNVDPETGLPFLKPALRRIQTLGATFSKALDAIVFRGDSIFHIQQPWTVDSFGIVKLRNVWRTILGMDITTENQVSVGFQYHLDYWREATLHSFSARFMKEFCKGKFVFGVFLYQGINNRDQWIQPQIVWKVNDNLEVSLRGDFLDGKSKDGTPKEGFIGPYRYKDRLFLWITDQF